MHDSAEIFAKHLLTQVQSALAKGSQSAALDIIYDELDQRLLTQDFAPCEAALQHASQIDLPLSVIIGFLTITLPWRQQLGTARSDLVDVARRMAYVAGGDAKVTSSLVGLL